MRQRSPAHKLVTETQLYLSAQRALMRRAHSIHEMTQHLERRAENKDLVPAIIARLRELNYLDDAITQVFAETDEPALVRARLRRRLALLHRKSGQQGAPLDQKKIASLYRNLLGAGFSADTIRAELKRITSGEVPDVDQTSEDGA